VLRADVGRTEWGTVADCKLIRGGLRRSACGKDEPGYASQETVYNDLGKDLLDHAFEGFNTCIIACE